MELNDLDPAIKTKLLDITSREIESFTDNDKAFLRARRDYLTKAEKERYAEILEIKKANKSTTKPA